MSESSTKLDGADSRQPTPQGQVSHDDTYFVKDFVIIQIQNRLFKIPRRHLVKQSLVFAKWSGKEKDPTIVHGVTVQEFRYFLEILLPDSTTDPVDLWLCNHILRRPSEEVWISVLKLSTKWFCLNMRLLATRNLNSISADKKWPPLKSILLGREYYIRHWVISGYKDLLTRSASISDEEAITVGLLESLRIMRMRESPSVTSCVDVEIQNVFKDELASIDGLNEAFISSADIRICVFKSGLGNQKTLTGSSESDQADED